MASPTRTQPSLLRQESSDLASGLSTVLTQLSLSQIVDLSNEQSTFQAQVEDLIASGATDSALAEFGKTFDRCEASVRAEIYPVVKDENKVIVGGSGDSIDPTFVEPEPLRTIHEEVVQGAKSTQTRTYGYRHLFSGTTTPVTSDLEAATDIAQASSTPTEILATSEGDETAAPGTPVLSTGGEQPHYFAYAGGVQGFQPTPVAPVTVLGGQTQQNFPRSWPVEFMSYRFPPPPNQPMQNVPWYETTPVGIPATQASAPQRYYISGTHGHYSPSSVHAMAPMQPVAANGATLVDQAQQQQQQNQHVVPHPPLHSSRRHDSGMEGFEF
ncbi:MAG: hypothetical protein M1832_001603 [Thelocarpon impressellum]|nr:MAG: hypothetical protein M1832_001603 [Thelocarpon impressellum]